MKYKEALEKIATVNAMDYEYKAWAKEALAQPEQEPVTWTVRRYYDDGTPHPCISLEWAGRNAEDDFPIGTKFFTAPPQRNPLDFGDFFEWANDEGYDTAHTHDGVKWVCLNPMTADLWKTWQAAHGIKGFV